MSAPARTVDGRVRPASSSLLHARRRARELAEVADGAVLDLLVVGAGTTGTGVALDAASRGLRVALVERADLAHGTARASSGLLGGGIVSSGLVPGDLGLGGLGSGGLRSLAPGRVGAAREHARERGVLLERTAPHLVRAVPVVVPFGDAVPRRDAAETWARARAADALSVAARTSRRALPPPRLLARAEVLALAPGVRRLGLRGGLQHWDAALEDDARLVVALARTAAAHGARVLTRVAAVRLRGDGADLRDELTGETVTVRAAAVVSATGERSGELGSRPSRGSHLVLPAAALGSPRVALALPVPGGRATVVVVPTSDGRVHVGRPGGDDVDALLAALSAALEVPVGRDDVLGSGDGTRGPCLRPGVSVRDDGVLRVVGGAPTTYRRAAEDAVDAVVARTGLPAGPCRTARLPLVGAAPLEALDAVPAPRRLVARYGTEAPAVAALADEDPRLAEPLADGLAVTGAEVGRAVRAEGALDVDDVLERRTGLALVPSEAAAARSRVEELVAAAREAAARQPATGARS